MSPSRKSAPAAVVGLDIGSDSIKVAEAKYARDGITLTGLGVGRTPEGAVENEVIVDPKALGAAIKQLLSESGIKTKKCVSAVGGQSQVVVRVIEVPKMTRDELTETMKWEIERHVPFSVNEVVKDFQPLERPNADPDAQNMEVLLAVAQQELIANHVEALQAAGLKPMAIDIEPLAASRSLIEASQNGASASEIVAIVNIGSNRTDVGIFEGGLLTFPSPPLGIAGMSFTREIAEALGQTLEQAEITKKEYAAVDVEALEGGVGPSDQGFASEPTSFDTVFAPPGQIAGAPEPGDQPVPGTEPADPGAFRDTVDGPVFDAPEVAVGPSFDLGEPAVPGFDLGDASAAQPATPAEPEPELGAEPDLLAAEPADIFAFDLGGDQEPAAEQITPDFDLEEESQASQEDQTAAPAFDLGDTDAFADPGEAVGQDAAPVSQPQAGSMEQAVFNAISGVLVDLAVEIRRSIEYYTTRYSKAPQRVILCGGTAKMPRLDEFLGRQLGIQVEVADPVKNVRANVPGASGQYLKEISPLFAVSIGLAIRDMVG